MKGLLVKLYGLNNRLIRRIIENLLIKIEGGYCYSSTIREIFSRYHGIDIGYGTYGGCFNYVNIPKPCKVKIGKYCSIGSGMKVFRANHPASRFTTHPVLYNPSFGFVEKDSLERYSLHIGNDVWIGSSVIICPGCRNIGNGAIIGAGSVVTHDVAPYTVVAGNPARIIRRRFDDEEILWLEKLKWWDLDIDTLKLKIPQIEFEFSK